MRRRVKVVCCGCSVVVLLNIPGDSGTYISEPVPYLVKVSICICLYPLYFDPFFCVHFLSSTYFLLVWLPLASWKNNLVCFPLFDGIMTMICFFYCRFVLFIDPYPFPIPLW